MNMTALIISILLSLSIFSDTILNKYNLEDKKPVTLTLPKELIEISGIAFNNSGKLFGHNDEASHIFEIDKFSGKVNKVFAFGTSLISGDFEDIAIVGDYFYVISSDGTLYEFTEGDNKKYVKYNKYLTGLRESNDVEGMCYDNRTNSLLLACKDFPGKGYKGKRAIYQFNLKTKKLESKPRFLISIDEVKKALKIKDFSPSGIVKHPKSGSFLIISAKDNAVVEINEDVMIMLMKKLNNKVHTQPEGMAIDSDKTLYISNEGGSKGTIVKYKMQ